MNKERQLEIRTNLENLYKNYRFEIKVTQDHKKFIVLVYKKKITIGSLTFYATEPMNKVYSLINTFMKKDL